MKLVVLTNRDSFYGKKVLNSLRIEDIPVQAIIVIKQPLRYYFRQYMSVKKRTGFIQSIYFSYKRLFHLLKPNKVPEFLKKGFTPNYDELGENVFYTHGTNSIETIKILKSLKPDILVLAQTGIVNKEILGVPSIGTLNAHPAILPYYRGIDCHQWALANKEYDKIGWSVHWVDEGVDTGGIISTSKYEFRGDENLDNLHERLENSGIKELVSIIKYSNYEHTSIEQKQEDGMQYFKIDLGKEKEARRNIELFGKI